MRSAASGEDAASYTSLVTPREGEVDVQLLIENRPLAVSEERLGDVIDLLAGEILAPSIGRSLPSTRIRVAIS